MRKLLTLMLLALLFAGNSYAQFVSYGFMPSNGTYTEITGGTLLGSETSDDQRYVDPAVPAGGTVLTGVGFPIGFNFVFNGVTFDRIGINNNGWITFGQSALTPAVDMATSSSYTPLSSTTIPTNPIHRNRAAAFGRDLAGQVGATLRIETIGTAPNQVCVIQWKNFRKYAATGDAFDFQIRLNETSNLVQFVYGPATFNTTSSTCQVGLGGAATTEFINRSSTTSWAASTPGTTNAASMTFVNTIYPASGLTYTFGPMAPLAAVYSSPTNGSTGMPTTVSLNWAPNTGDGGGAPQGYMVYMGTDVPPTNIANGTDVGSALTYTPAAPLNTATVYNWQIVPYNTVGNATGNATYSFTTTLGIGSLEGYTTNGFGIPLGGVNVSLYNGLTTLSTTSAANGFYQFSLISAGNYQLTASLATYNNTVLNVTVAPSVTTYQNVLMLRPSMAITPNPYSVAANPNELVDGALNIANNGDGVLGWTASISYTSPGPNSWLTLGQASGSVAAYTNFNVPLAFNATGLTTGTVKTAEITFTSNPNVGTVVVPVSLTVSGVALAVPFELEANVTNPISGDVNLSWSFTANRAFQFFIVKRNGVQVGTTANTVYTETLPAYGVYSYTVQAVYDEGNSAPAGPVVVEWANPTLVLNPTTLYNEQYPNTSEAVTFRLSNTGEGTLAYTFPEYAARQLVSSPGFTPNVRSAVKEVEVAKGEVDPTDNMGNRNLRGAGGPDGFGYMWIDSDESGGPAYVWNDISGTGTVLTGLTDDSFVGPVSLGINFPFYANTYSQVYVGSNGFLSFGSGNTSLSNQNLPSSSTPNDLIAWFWDDMNPGVSGTVYYQTVGNEFVIQFNNYNEYGGTGQITAQVRLNQNGDIAIYYNSITGGLDILSATVGIENADGTIGTSINYNSAYVANNKAVWIGLPTPSFISSVVPAQGQVAPGEFVDVVATFTSDDEDFPVGTYTNELELTTNDLAHATVLIPATMVVYNPGMISGNVTAADDNAPIHGAIVTAGPYTASTDEEGNYSIIVDAGTYNMTFSKTGYTSESVSGVIVTETNTTVVDAELEEIFYAPTLVNAVVNADDTQTDVTWGVPEPSYEALYDDGTAENYAAWALPGNVNAVKFTPAGYPAHIYGGRIFVGDGTFPNNNTGFIGTTFGAVVYAADGANGLPGTTLDSISVTVNNLGWVDFTGLDAVVASGSFYLGMVQGAVSPNCAPVGIDQTLPTVYRSYSRNVGTGGNWGLSPYQDMMIRAFMSGPVDSDDATLASNVRRSPLKQRGLISQSPALAQSGVEGNGQYLAIQDGASTRDLTSYKVWRVSGFDPNDGPELGTLTLLSGTVANTNYTDAAYGPLPQGWYAYAVAANYTNGGESVKVFSNIVGHKLLVDVTCNVSLTTGGSPAGAVVSLAGQDYPYAVYTQTVPESGTVVFEDVWKGNYILEASKVGFDDYVLTPNITSNRTFDILLLERKYMPRNLYVDGLTLVATWDEPLAIAVAEDFEGAVFPPAGWQALTQNTTGWYATTNGSSSSFAIPAHTKYAVTNDDADNGDGCCDYLITPEMDWSNLPSYRLNFASYYDGSFSQSAYVEISTDAGATWTVINSLTPAPGSWQNIEIDLAQFSGASGLGSVWLAFHADDNGEWASGWAVDDIQIASGGVPLQGYGVFLDGTLVDNTPERTYTYSGLNYGQEYLAGVAALFSSGYSELDTYRFTCTYLIPPTNLAGDSPAQTDYAHLTWVAPVTPADYTASTPVARTEMPLSSVEYSPMVTNVTYANTSGSRELWDVLVSFNAQAASLPGIEADNQFIYISNWQGTNFGKYQFDGTWVEDFTVSGAANIRDMAYDGEFFYGGQASTTIYKMDFNTQTLAGTIASSVSVRHIAYDPTADGGNGGFWAGNWSDLAQISMTGSTLQTVSGLPFTGMYGSAWDGQSDGGPFLWIFDQGGNGADIHQFSTETLALTGIMHDASTVPGFNAGLAGGMAASNNVVADKFVLIANIQQDPNFIVGFELGEGGGGGGGLTPANLLGYNIYRDDALTAYVEKPALEYFDLNLMPGTYSYHITAVYDLTPYGFAGQTGESMIEGPVDVTISYGYELPFTENFNTGLLETNQWSVDGGNWRIAGQVGNDAPSVEFYYNPAVTDYTQSLSSFYMIGSGIIDGKIMMDFDLKHTLVNATEEEFLAVEISNGGAWVKVGEFKNTANIDWTTETVDLTSLAKGHVFRVRFTASGANTLDIFNWLIDNVSIYRVCAPPVDLVGDVNFPDLDQVILNWEAPTGGGGGGVSAWLGWDNGTNNDAIGLTNGGTFSVAVRFTPAQLAQYAGTSLTKIRMFPYAAGGTIALKVWTGANASTLVLTQPVASYTEGIWNEFALTTPVAVTGATELWFGYTVTHAAGSYVAGCDAGPAVAGFGDMISLDGSVWESMSTAYGLDYNWNLNGYVESVDGVTALQPISDNTVYGPASQLVRGNLPMLPGATVTNNTAGASRELVGYNVWRDGELIGNTAELTYVDADEVLEIGETYCYVVTAVYEDCESLASNEVCVTLTSTPVIETSAVSVYPNPSNSVVNIALTSDISQLVVYNYVGQVVYEQNVTKAQTIQLNVRNYESGAYLVKFITSAGESFTKKVVVTK
ncbi:MAG: carboxypeptidase regulatory-like domain-containing protein [Bacteroidales bacterium]|nr:carboxypeptidase regulatory-like domain-containing protein [Bacteroidales bacterium]